MIDLKPCPFCGGEAICIEHPFFITGENTYVIRCCECKAETWKFYGEKEEAIEAWNRRAKWD